MKWYLRIGFTFREMFNLLVHQYRNMVGIRILKRIEKKLCLIRRRNYRDVGEIITFWKLSKDQPMLFI